MTHCQQANLWVVLHSQDIAPCKHVAASCSLGVSLWGVANLGKKTWHKEQAKCAAMLTPDDVVFLAGGILYASGLLSHNYHIWIPACERRSPEHAEMDLAAHAVNRGEAIGSAQMRSCSFRRWLRTVSRGDHSRQVLENCGKRTPRSDDDDFQIGVSEWSALHQEAMPED